MSVYMEPLIDDSQHTWEEGVWTYDRATKTNFKMRVWYMYSLHDLPAHDLENFRLRDCDLYYSLYDLGDLHI